MRRLLLAGGGVLGALAVFAQLRIGGGGKLQNAPPGTSLTQIVRTIPGPAWIAYTIDAVPAQRGCCTSIQNGVFCPLEGGAYLGEACSASEGSTVYLEGERTANVLLRVDKGEVERVRVLSPSCGVDVGNLTIHWSKDVRAADSVASLKTATAARGAVGAIAQHADPSAEAFLRETAESVKAERKDRERAAQALAAHWGANGLAVVRRLLETPSGGADDKFRESLPGALAQAPNGAGISALMDAALRDKDRKVRERAFFWLGRSKDVRAQQFVGEILAR